MLNPPLGDVLQTSPANHQSTTQNKKNYNSGICIFFGCSTAFFQLFCTFTPQHSRLSAKRFDECTLSKCN